MMNIKNTLLITGAWALIGSADAAKITWIIDAEIKNSGVVDTTGNLVLAHNYGAASGSSKGGTAGNHTVGGVTFTQTAMSGAVAGFQFNSGIYKGAADPDFHAVMNSAVYGNAPAATITVSGLTANTSYRIQVFGGDARGGNRVAHVANSDGSGSASGVAGEATSFIGTFTTGASETSVQLQSFTNPGDHGIALSALQIRTLSSKATAGVSSTVSVSPPSTSSQPSTSSSSVSREFIDNLDYIGVILDNPKYYTWGTSVVQGDDGKFHMYSCQWELKNGFHNWHRDSMVNYYVAAKATGPYKFVKTIVGPRPGGDKDGVWNRYTAHNPEVKRIDGYYVLTYISYPKVGAIPEAKIGLKVAKSPEGPWKDVRTNNGMIMQKSADPKLPSYKSGRGTDNSSLVKYQNKYYLFFMYKPPVGADNTSLGVAVSDSLFGPYKEQETPVLLPGKGKKVEDLCVYLQGGSIHAVMCDNFGIQVANGGIYCEMDQNLFKKSGEVKMTIKSIAYDTRPRMFPDQDFSHGKHVYGANKFERPKVVKVDGVPTYLFLPSGFNAKGNPWSNLHGFKFKKTSK